MEHPKSKESFETDLPTDSQDQLNESGPPYRMELPIAPAWFSEAPKGRWEDGYSLSIQAIQSLRDPEQVVSVRSARMVDVEFTM